MTFKIIIETLLLSVCNGFIFYHTTPPRHVTISVGKVNGILPGIDEPGTVIKSPLKTS